MTDKLPVVNEKKYMVCRICISACPFGCLSDDKFGVDFYNKAYPQLASVETCTGCGICTSEYPVDVITMVTTSITSIHALRALE